MAYKEPNARLKILKPKFYGMDFVTARRSRHVYITYTYKNPLRRVTSLLDAMVLYRPIGKKIDLIHTYNRIPITGKPWVISHESWLPRLLTQNDYGLRSFLLSRLAKSNCHYILSMSEYAWRIFESKNRSDRHWKTIEPKCIVQYPNVELRECRKNTSANRKLRILFVGNDFAQKGGIATLRVADRANREKLNVEFTLVSKLRLGKEVFADCPVSGAYDKDLELLKLPNVRHLTGVNNAEVLKLMDVADIVLLPTLDDTFGFSTIEAMAGGTSVISTNVCALPEILEDGQNGFIINLPLDVDRKWKLLGDRSWETLDRTYDYLADSIYNKLEVVSSNPRLCADLGQGAYETARAKFESSNASKELDSLYDHVAGQDR